MTAIGKKEFPEMTVTEAIEFADAVKRDKVQTVPALGKVMGLGSTKSGFAFVRISAMSKYYGLIDRNKNTVTLTSLAKRVVYATSEERRREAIREVALRVPLIGELYASLGTGYHELDFPERLAEITGATPEEIASKSSKIEKVYSDAVRYLSDAPTVPALDSGAHELKGGRNDTGASPPGSGSRTAPGLAGLGFHLAADNRHWMYQDGETILRVEKNRKKIRTAIGTLTVWLNESPPETSDTPPVDKPGASVPEENPP